MTVFVGIDSGLNGAISWCIGNVLGVEDNPTIGGKIIDYDGVYQLVDSIYCKAGDAKIVVTIEEPNGKRMSHFAKGSHTGALSLGKSIGSWMLAWRSLGATVVPVEPDKWKRTMGVTADKQTSMAACERLFPQSKSMIYGPRGGALDGRAESILIMEYGRKTWILKGSNGC